MNIFFNILLLIAAFGSYGFAQISKVETRSPTTSESRLNEKLTDEDALREVVFRRLLELKDEANRNSNSFVTYLAVDTNRDLSKLLLNRLQKRWPNLKNDSECRIDFDSTVVDAKTGERGMRLSISRIKRTNPNEAEVETRDYVGEMGGHGSGHHQCKYKLRKEKERWRIVAEECLVS